MPLFAEYEDRLLQHYQNLAKRDEKVYEAGVFHNTPASLHRRLWDGKDVLYVIGSRDTSKKYDINLNKMFDNAKSFSLLETVNENALSDHYDEILNRILTFSDLSRKMILLSQGMAGTVLAHDLSSRGYHAIDLGQPFVRYRSRRKTK